MMPDDAARVTLARWQFPTLDPGAGSAASLAPLRPVDPPPPPPPPPPRVVAEPMPERPVEPEVDRDAEARRALQAATEQAIAAGHADGVIRGHAEGKEKGYAEGFAAGSRAAQEAQAAQLDRLTALVERLGSPIPVVERAIEEALVALALEVARYVIGTEIAQNPQHLARLVREALAQAPLPMTGVQVVLNPADRDFLRTAAPEIERGGAALVADPAVEPGGAQIVIADGAGGAGQTRDRRWHPRNGAGVSQIDLSLAGRWRNAMLTLFDGEDK
jgi:flagellar assembly protein FliH